MQYELPSGSWAPSTIYKWEDFIQGVKDVYTKGIGTAKLWLGSSPEQDPRQGLVTLATFIAQSMKETIRYNACDENNWDTSTNYAASNACGQLGQSYQDYKCSAEEAHMQCEVDPSMEIRATTHATWYGAPPAFFCAPRTKIPRAPLWSYGGWCDPKVSRNTKFDSLDKYFAYVFSGEECRDYAGQRAGKWNFCDGGCPNAPAPAFGKGPRTDVEGCCWWGRGVIQTTGVCNFGKLNYYIGTRAASEGREALFPDIDFCKDPGAICTSQKYPQLKWIAGLFYHINNVQEYNTQEFNFKQKVEAWVANGMSVSDTSLIDAVSGIVNRGCPRLSCQTGTVDGAQERRANFAKVLAAMGF